MKKLAIVVTALCVGGLLAESPAALRRRRATETREQMMQRTGGMVVIRSQGPAFRFVNAQKAVGKDDLKVVPETIERILALPIIFEDGEVACPMKDAGKFLDPKTAACVFLCEGEGMPTLLVAPEARWGAVNVSALKADSPSADVLAVRVRKEMWRAFAYVMGAAHSSFPGCLMTTVTSLGELDTVRAETISPEPLQKINQHAGKLGMTRNRVGTYKRACAEGWAPPPENEWQRKIAEEVKKAEAEKKAAEKK